MADHGSSSQINDSGDTERVLANCPIPQKWKSYPARELNPGSSAIAAVALTTELLSWDSIEGLFLSSQ